MLALSNVTAAYDQVPVLNGLSLELKRGEVLALLGRNGVGKTTLLRTIMGLLPRSSGSIALDDTRLDGVPSHMIARLGVVLVPQGRGILPKLSVRENLVVGGRAAATRGPMPLREILDRFPALKDRMNQLGGTLSGGQQQQLAIARALSARPRIMLLDEPTEGIQPNVVQDLAHTVLKLVRDTQLSVLLVEQNIDFAMQLATRCMVMEKGRIVHEGDATELRDDMILKRYLAI
jgi:urea ABC transporter ATP-binding protein UrtE